MDYQLHVLRINRGIEYWQYVSSFKSAQQATMRTVEFTFDERSLDSTARIKAQGHPVFGLSLESDFQKRIARHSAIEKLEAAHTLIELLTIEVRIDNAWLCLHV